MFTLVFTILIGVGISLFAVQNTHAVTLVLANYPLTGIPLYIIVVLSLLLGIIVSFVTYLMSSLSSSFAISKRDRVIRSEQTTIEHLQEKIHDLEIENTRLRGEPETAERKTEEKQPHHQWTFPFLRFPRMTD